MSKNPVAHLKQRLLSRFSRVVVRNGDMQGRVIALRLRAGADRELATCWIASIAKVDDDEIQWTCLLADIPRAQDLLRLAVIASNARLARRHLLGTGVHWSEGFWRQVSRSTQEKKQEEIPASANME